MHLLFLAVCFGAALAQATACPPHVLKDAYTKDGVCYQFFIREEQRGSYLEARKLCAGLNGTMAMPKSASVNTWLTDVVTEDYEITSDVWIGLNDLEADGTFKWEDSKPVDYTNFASDPKDDPDSFFNNCVAASACTGKWGVHFCATGDLWKKKGIVCQFSS